jgi:hypothetical protein
MQFNFENPREYVSINNHYIDCSRCSITYWFRDGSMVNCACPMRVLFTPSLKIEWIDQRCMEYTEMLSRTLVSSMFNAAQTDQSLNGPPGGPGSMYMLPPSKVTAFGVSSSVMRFLECAETISHMRDLMAFSADPSSGGPLKALESLARVLQNRALQQQGPQNEQSDQHQNQKPQQQQSPGGSQQPNGSESMRSPAAFQQQQHGHTRASNAASTSASPRITKRRRASVKSDATGDSPKVKQSPSLAKK